ncbi:MAG: hypothetical protein MJ246_05070 [Clostridia bacterium]|nr:hypothetical protein [Clostridia bacterium]
MAKTTSIQKIFTIIALITLCITFGPKLVYAEDLPVDISTLTPEQQISLGIVPETPAPAPVAVSPMPTVANMDNPANANKVGNVAGTDQWNDMIYIHCMNRGIDPVFVKAIMTVESGGNVAAKNGSYLGLYQVGKSFGYDSKLMLSDPDYQTEAAIDVIYSKIAVAYDLKVTPNVYYVAKFYNGSESYAKTVSRIYEDLNGIEGSSKTNLVKIF